MNVNYLVLYVLLYNFVFWTAPFIIYLFQKKYKARYKFICCYLVFFVVHFIIRYTFVLISIVFDLFGVYLDNYFQFHSMILLLISIFISYNISAKIFKIKDLKIAAQSNVPMNSQKTCGNVAEDHQDDTL